MPTCEHDVDDVQTDEIDVPPKIPTQPSCDKDVEDSGTEEAYQDYEYLILKLDHFKRGKSTVGKHIVQDESPDAKLKK